MNTRALLLLSLLSWFAPGCAVTAPTACDGEIAITSVCDGRELVATCSDGLVSRTTCDDSACPAGKRALGCRIGHDDRAFCECGCTEQDDVCASTDTLRVCIGGHLIDFPCSEECKAAGLGPPILCDPRNGRATCICHASG